MYYIIDYVFITSLSADLAEVVFKSCINFTLLSKLPDF